MLRKRARANLDDFLAYVIEEVGRAPRTAQSYRTGLKLLLTHSGVDLFELGRNGAPYARAFKRDPAYSPSTKQLVIVSAKQFNRWGALEGIWPLNGIQAVPGPRIVFTPKPPLGLHTARNLLASCISPQQYRVIYLGLYAGLRIGESCSIRESNWHGNRLTFIGKGGKKRTVPVHPELEKVKFAILAANPASVGSLHMSFAKLRERTGAKDTEGGPAKSHSLRRTCADYMYDKAGFPQEVVAAILGHGKRPVTELYAPVRFEKMQEAIESINYFTGEPVQLALFE